MNRRKSAVLTALPPLLTAALLGLLFYFGGLYPFGEKSVAWCDMKQQVIPLMMDFKDILSGRGNLFYSTANAGGMNFWGVFFFFLASPFSLLCAFVDKADMPGFMNILVLLKLSACALTASLYFQRRHPKLEGLAVPLSMMYAFCGYGMLFYQNIIWLDMMALFPLLLLSFWYLAEQKRIFPYLMMMALTVSVNYYIGYMVVLFAVLFFGLYLLAAPRGERRETALRFIIGSFGAALLSAVVWLPSFIQYLTSGRGSDIIAGLRSTALTGHLETNLSLLLCTAFILPALVFFFVARGRWDEKLKLHLVLLLLMTIPVFIEPVNKMWHTGNYMSFPVRYGFITIFLGLSTAALTLERVMPPREKKGNFWAFWLFAAAAAGLLVFGCFYFQQREKELTRYVRTLWADKNAFWGLLIFFAAALVCYEALLFAKHKGLLNRKSLSVLLTMFVVAESCFSLQVYMTSARDKLDIGTWRQTVDLSGRLPEDEFARVKTAKKDFDVNLIGALGYPTFAHYTSLTSEDTLFTMKRLGYSSYWMEVGSHGGTAFTDALLSIGYEISAGRQEDAVYQNDRYSLTALQDFLPLGLVTGENLFDQEELPEGQRIPVQQALFSALFSSGETLFTPYRPDVFLGCDYQYQNGKHYFFKDEEAQSNTITWTIQVNGRQTLYFDCFDRCSNALKESINDSFQVAVNGVAVAASYPSQSQNGLLNLGTYENQSVTVTAVLLKNTACRSFGVWGLDRNLLAETVQSAQTVGFTEEKGAFTGAYENRDGEAYCFLSLPWDEGYRVEVNGSRVEAARCLGNFLAVPLQEGENQIRITFRPRGFSLGAALSIAGLLFCGLYLLMVWKRPDTIGKAVRSIGGVSLWSVWLLFAAVILAVYLGPVALSIIG